MENNLLPLFKFPTTIILIDDDELFVKSVAEYLLTVSDSFKVETYTSPTEILSKLNKDMILSNFIKPILPLYKNESSKISLEFDLQQKYDVYEKAITCIIVDYDMPGMDGIEFLEKIEDLKICKILLTGVADESKAVNAFNQGIIDCYLKKDGNDLFKDLINKVKKGIDAVFSNSTSPLAYTISNTEKNTLIGDQGYKEIFDYYVDKYNINHFKIIDEIGSYYMQSSEKEYILYIIPGEKNDAVVEYIEDFIIENGYEQIANEVFLSELKDRKKIIWEKLVYKKEIDFKEIENFAEKANLYESKLGKYYYYFSERFIPFK